MEPKEDGEVGETIRDVLLRHGQELDGKLGDMVKELEDHVELFGQNTLRMVGRMLSAALSPMPHKASPEEAGEALDFFVAENLPLRKSARKKAMAKQLSLERQNAEEMRDRIMKEIARKTENKRRKRELKAPEAPERKKRDNYGNLVGP